MATVEISYAATEAVLTATLGEAVYRDSYEVNDQIALSFDAAELGRLVDVQVLAPQDRDDTWRSVLTGCLGRSFARRCLELIDGEEDVSLEPLTIPAKEWAALRAGQWPTLHRGWRHAVMKPPLPELPPRRRRSPAVAVRSVVAPFAPLGPIDARAGPAGFRFSAVLAAAVAVQWRIHDEVEVILQGANAHLVARTRETESDRPPTLEALLLTPAPRSDEAVPFRPHNGVVRADVALRAPVDVHRLPALVVRMDAPLPDSPSSRFLLLVRQAGRPADGAVRRVPGIRSPAPAGTLWADVLGSATSDHLYWEKSGKPRIEVFVFREGASLYARVLARKSRRSKWVRLTAVLRPEAVAVLQPNGELGPGPVRVEAEGTVGPEGMVQMRLATVEKVDFRGELVEHLQLEVG